MAPIPEERAVALRDEIFTEFESDSDLQDHVMVDVSMSWDSDASAEIVVDFTAESRFVDLDAVLDDAVEVIRTCAEALEIPGSLGALPVVFDQSERGKHRACVFVDIHVIHSRGQIQTEIFLSTNDPEKEWKEEQEN